MRAVVMADRLILIVPDGADSLIAILDKYMKEWVRLIMPRMTCCCDLCTKNYRNLYVQVSARKVLSEMESLTTDTSPMFTTSTAVTAAAAATVKPEPPLHLQHPNRRRASPDHKSSDDTRSPDSPGLHMQTT